MRRNRSRALSSFVARFSQGGEFTVTFVTEAMPVAFSSTDEIFDTMPNWRLQFHAMRISPQWITQEFATERCGERYALEFREAGQIRVPPRQNSSPDSAVANYRFYPRHNLRASDAPCSARPSAPLALRQLDWGATVAVVPARSAKRLYSDHCHIWS